MSITQGHIIKLFLPLFIMFCSDQSFAGGEITPFIGAQVFIEPGQSQEDIEEFFRILSENNLSACRIRMFESYMRDENFNWDFSLFDHAFEAADEYGIKIWATLYPVTGDNINIGGDKFPDTEAKHKSIARYIEKTVNHFKSYECLAGWVLINEPGVRGEVPDQEFSRARFAEWEDKHEYPLHNDKGYPILMNFKNEKFLLDYTTWYLDWLSSKIQLYDKAHDLHVNNHDLFVNASEYNFPQWRKFLSSMGGSAHPSWHFTYFDRNKYAVAMSADCEMVYSGAGDLPWFMTEIQGGNNTYSGFAPMCPTAEEITQWLWITLGTEGKGAIFWSLNPRSSGVEAGEWAMINYQKQASDRLMAAGKVARSLEDNLEVLKLAKKADPHIHILYSRESMWAEKQMTIWESDYLARENGAVIKSAFAYFEAFCEMGISPNIKELGEFDFSKDNYEGETIILSNQISLPSVHVKSFEHFVDRGGKLIVDALTAYFDENMHNTMITGFDYEKLFGGNVSEFKFQDNIFSLSIDETVLSAHAWKGFVAPTSGTAIKNSTGENIGIRNRFGKGEVVWIPSMLGLGSRIGHSYSGLCTFLEKEAGTSIRNQPVKFSMPVKNTLMKTLKSGDSIITIIINKDKEAQTIVLEFNQEMEVQKILSADSRVKISDHSMTLNPEETLVVLWE